MECKCNRCGMTVKGLTCGKCNSSLQKDTMSIGSDKVQVAKCPQGCGQIKSPVCCGQDMICL